MSEQKSKKLVTIQCRGCGQSAWGVMPAKAQCPNCHAIGSWQQVEMPKDTQVTGGIVRGTPERFPAARRNGEK